MAGLEDKFTARNIEAEIEEIQRMRPDREPGRRQTSFGAWALDFCRPWRGSQGFLRPLPRADALGYESDAPPGSRRGTSNRGALFGHPRDSHDGTAGPV